MAQIPPIEDSYIDDVIRAAPYDPGLNKTQGIKLRELVKLMRDQMIQSNTQINDQYDVLSARIANLETRVYKYTPEPPSGGRVDDTLNLFTYTANFVYSDPSDYEYTLDNGVTILTDSNVFGAVYVGNVDVPAGYLKVRVTGNINRNPSAWLTNSQPFTKQ